MRLNMKKITLLAVFSLFTMTIFAQKSLTIQEVKDKYGLFVKAVKKESLDRVYIDKIVVVPEEDEVLSEFVTINKAFIELIITNYSSISSDGMKKIRDSLKLQAKFLERLQADQLFNQYCLPYLCAFYQSKGYTISDYNTPKKTHTFDEMIDVAVKYFELKNINSRGEYNTRIGINEDGLIRTLDVRNPLLEIFCLNSIKKNNYKAYQAMAKAKKSAQKLQLGLDDNDRFKIAQGAIYVLLSVDESFRDFLKVDYEKNAKQLPFTIKF